MNTLVSILVFSISLFLTAPGHSAELKISDFAEAVKTAKTAITPELLKADQTWACDSFTTADGKLARVEEQVPTFKFVPIHKKNEGLVGFGSRPKEGESKGAFFLFENPGENLVLSQNHPKLGLKIFMVYVVNAIWPKGALLLEAAINDPNFYPFYFNEKNKKTPEDVSKSIFLQDAPAPLYQVCTVPEVATL